MFYNKKQLNKLKRQVIYSISFCPTLILYNELAYYKDREKEIDFNSLDFFKILGLMLLSFTSIAIIGIYQNTFGCILLANSIVCWTLYSILEHYKALESAYYAEMIKTIKEMIHNREKRHNW